MRPIASFASLLALGLLAGGVLTLATQGPSPQALSHSVDGTGALDFRSMLIGLLLGLMLSSLSRVPWAQVPRRIVGWVISQEHNLFYIAIGTVFVGILIFY